jgi:hypothetical protein
MIFSFGEQKSWAQIKLSERKFIHAVELKEGVGDNKYTPYPSFGVAMNYNYNFGNNFVCLGFNVLSELVFSILGPPPQPDETDEFFISYNRKFIFKPFQFHLGTGIGYTVNNISKEHITGSWSDYPDRVITHDISLPLDASILYPQHRKFKIGLFYHFSYNKTNSYYLTGLIFRFEFKKAGSIAEKRKAIFKGK